MLLMPKPPRLRPLYAFGDATGNRTPVAGETVRHNYRYTMAPFIIKEEPTLYISIKLPIHVHPKELQKYRAGFEPASLFLNLYVYIITQNFKIFKLFHFEIFRTGWLTCASIGLDQLAETKEFTYNVAPPLNHGDFSFISNASNCQSNRAKNHSHGGPTENRTQTTLSSRKD